MTEPRTTARAVPRAFPAGPSTERFAARTYAADSIPRHVLSRRRGNGLGTAARTLGVLGLALCWVPIVGVLCAVLGVVFGVTGLGRGRREGTGTDAAIAGLVLGAVSLVPAVIILVVVIGA